MKLIEYINKKTFCTIIDGISRESNDSIPQCYYVAGDLGYGKTTLLYRLKQNLNQERFAPLYIDCLLNPITNEDKLEEITYGLNPNKRSVLLLDNAHHLLESWSESELSKLRALIYTPGAPIIVFSGKRVTKIFTDYSAPLYNSVMLLSLTTLSEEEQSVFLQDIGKNKECYHKIASTLGPSILIMTLICKAIKQGKRKEEAIKGEILSYFNIPFDNLLASLSPIQLLITVAILKSESPCLLSDIATETGLKSSDITSQLKRLEQKQLIEIIKWKPKKSLYQIKNKTFKEWYKWKVKGEDTLVAA